MDPKEILKRHYKKIVIATLYTVFLYSGWPIRVALHNMGIPVFEESFTADFVVYAAVTSACWAFFLVWIIEGIRYGVLLVARRGS